MNDYPHDVQQLAGRDAAPKNSIFSQFAAPISEVPDVLPANLMPYRHLDPVLDDPSATGPDWDTIFGRDLELTDTKEGLRSQKVNRNIAEIASAIRNRCEFLHIAGHLAVFEPPCWKILGHGEALRFVKRAAEELFPSDAKYLNCRQYEEIVSHLRLDFKTPCQKEIPTPDYRYLCCRDYMYDWRTGRCLPHNSKYQYFSYLDIDAESIGSCDGAHWEMFLDDMTGGDSILRQRILEMIGVILSGYPSKSFFFLTGESGTGKSQLVNFLRDVLGTSACVALNDISQLGQKWTTGSVFGKLLCLCGDVPDAPLDSRTIGTIKQLTGDDLIRGEFKYKDAFMFDNMAKLLFVSNYPLRIPNPEREQALLERLVVIPCRNPVARECQIPNLHELLYEEAGYIVDLAMRALADLDDRNGVFTSLPEDFGWEPAQVSNMDRAIMEFVHKYCVREEGASCWVSEVFQAFQAHFPEENLRDSQFSKALLRLFPEVKKVRSSSGRKYNGLRLAETDYGNPS